MDKDKELVKQTTELTTTLSPEGSLNRYLQEIHRYPMLEAEEEYMLAKSYADHGDTKAAHKLVTSHLRLVSKISTGYRGYGLPIEEVISEGNIGLMKAVKKFDAERGFRLATYAMWWIRASIQEYILRSWSLVKIGTTVAQKKLFFNLRKLKGKINAIDGKTLKPEQVEEVSKRLNVSEKDVRLMDNRLSASDHSLNAPIHQEGEGTTEWQDWLTDETDNQETTLVKNDEFETRKMIMQEALLTLKDREIEILEARRLQDPPTTLEVLSHHYSISRERVRQIEIRAFEKLQHAMKEQATRQGIIATDVINKEEIS